jgi:hypothetical protein
VNLGGGEDIFTVNGDSTDETIQFFGKFELKAEGADDIVEAGAYVYFYDNAKFDGGAGYDILDIADATFLGNVNFKNFELIA